ncbi:MAG: restriction endonuclease subunit S [Thiothrix sp.]|nr:MAG: restriction endonuclease subunit S [Thiothrix sp.]
MSYPLVSIKDFCTTSSGGTPSREKPEYYTGSIPWIKSGDLKENIVTLATEFLSEEAIQNSSAKIVKKGAILLAMYGATVGRMAILGIDAATNQAVCSIVPDESKAFPKYVYYALLDKVPEFLRNAVGGAQPNINQGIIKETKIPLPPLAEQKRIAAILDKADAIRRKRQQAIQLADDFLRSVFLDMFGDPMTNPKGWEVKLLGAIATKIGSGSTPKGGKESYVSEGISLIRSLNIHDDRFLHKDLAFLTNEQAKQLSNVVVQANDVLLNITGASVCRCTLVDNEVLPARVNQHVCIIRVPSLSSSYLMHLIIAQSYKKYLLNIATANGATREALTKEQIENLPIPIPPLEVQHKFSAIKDSITKLKKYYANFHADESFNSLSQKAFSGQL